MPSNTPLTDAINALTQYANETTGQSDTTLSDAVGTLVAGYGGGSEVSTAIKFVDYQVQSTKWVIDKGIPNYVINGGCIHIKATIPSDITDADDEGISFGADVLSSWTTSTNCACYWLFYPQTRSSLRFRGSTINATIVLNDFMDQNNEFEIKLYKDRFVDVKTNTTYLYSSDSAYTDVQTAMNNLCNYNYISVGSNQGRTRKSGMIISYFAVEAS